MIPSAPEGGPKKSDFLRKTSMMKIHYWQGIGLCGLAAFSLGAAAQEASPKWGPHIDVEAKPGSKRTLGEADLFLPLSQDASTLVFANLRGRFDNQTSREGNLGLGVRHMLEGGWNLGAYGYADRRRSPDSGYYYNQVTLGAEALGRDWDFRANTYLPRGTRVRELSTSTVVGIPTAALVGTTIQVTTPGSITTTREERSLKGYDMEAGWRAPIFDSEAAHQLRLFVGGYRFSDDAVTVDGSRVRAELAMDDLNWFGKGTRLFLGLEAQHDGVRGHQNFVSVRLRIPLGRESARPSTLSAQERRMTAPVMRDVDVVTNARTVSTTAPTIVETATATSGGQAITVVSSAATAGNDLDSAVAGAAPNSTIIISGTFNVSGGNTVVVDGGRTLRAGATTVRTASGREAVLTTSAAVIGTNVNVSTIQLVNNATLAGVTVSNAYNNGSGGAAVLLAGGAGNITVRDNTISIAQSGANSASALSLGGNNANVLVAGNTLTATGSGAALTMTALSAFANVTMTVSGNTFSASGGGINRAVSLPLVPIVVGAGSSGNVRVSGDCFAAGGVGGSIVFTSGPSCPL